MSDSQSEYDTYDSVWMDDEVPDHVKNLWQEAVKDYMTYHNVSNPDHLKYTADLARKMIVHVGIRDARWKRFPVHTFNSNGQKAERVLYHGLKKKVEELQREAKKLKEDR